MAVGRRVRMETIGVQLQPQVSESVGRIIDVRNNFASGDALRVIVQFDIDVVIDRDVLGFGGDSAPGRAGSKKQLRKRLKALRVATQKLVNEDLHSAVAEVIRQQTSSASACKLSPDDHDLDKQTLLLSYPTVFPGSLSYLGQEVKIELGARSDTEPTEGATIESRGRGIRPQSLKICSVFENWSG